MHSFAKVDEPAASNEYLDAIKAVVGKEGPPVEFKFEERDSILYNLGLGAKATELKYTLYVLNPNYIPITTTSIRKTNKDIQQRGS